MAHAFYDYLKTNGLEKVLLALSLDGENKNTGADHGFLRRVELMIGELGSIFIF